MRRLIDAALAGSRPSTLAFGDEVTEARASIEGLDVADGLRAGLWLLHDFMDQAHGIVQDIDTTGAAYWHAIVHRREPDAGNAAYWYARVAEHPIFAELARDAAAILVGHPALAGIVAGGRFHARRFIDLATASRPPASAAHQALLALQRREWELLFDHEWSLAKG